MNIISRALLVVLFAAGIAVAQTKTTDNGWPRKFAVGTSSVAVYQPQIEEWTGNSFSARAAMAITESWPYTYGYGAAFTWGVTSGWGLAYTSVYGQWGNVAYAGTRAAWANPYTGNVGYGGAA